MMKNYYKKQRLHDKKDNDIIIYDCTLNGWNSILSQLRYEQINTTTFDVDTFLHNNTVIIEVLPDIFCGGGFLFYKIAVNTEYLEDTEVLKLIKEKDCEGLHIQVYRKKNK